MIQLFPDQLLPGGAAGSTGSRQTENVRAVGHPGNGPGLYRRGLDILVGEHSEHLPEAIQNLVQQGLHGFRRAIPAGHAGAAGADHDLYAWIGNPAGHFGPDTIDIVGHDAFLRQLVPRLLQTCHQRLAGDIVGLDAAVGNHQHGNFQGNKFSFGIH